MSSKAVMMMIIIRTGRNYDDLSPTLRSRMQLKTSSPACAPLRLRYVNIWHNVRTDERSWAALVIGWCAASHTSLPTRVASLFQQQLRNVTGGTAAILWTLQRALLDYSTGRSSQMASCCSSIHSTAQYVLIHVCSLNVRNTFQQVGIFVTRWWHLPAKHTLVMAFKLQDPSEGINSVN